MACGIVQVWTFRLGATQVWAGELPYVYATANGCLRLACLKCLGVKAVSCASPTGWDANGARETGSSIVTLYYLGNRGECLMIQLEMALAVYTHLSA